MHSIGGFGGGATTARGRGTGGSKVDQAYLALKRAIVSGTLSPETPIDKNEWCAVFEVSKLSITTAINRLAFEGLVVVEPQRGSYVARIHLTRLRLRPTRHVKKVAPIARFMTSVGRTKLR